MAIDQGPRDIRELLAWCQGRAMPLQSGPGGIPGMTAEDVAGAVGLMFDGKPHFAREVLLQVHWRAAAGPRREFEQLLLGMIRKETLKRMIDYGTAKVAHDEALANYEDSTHHTDRQFTALNALANRARALKSFRFPDQPSMWPRLRDACLAELSHPNHCQACDGRGSVWASVVTDCTACDGKGLVPVSDRQRAQWLKRDESSYRETWRVMYEWLFSVLSAAELAGVREFRARLFGRRDQAA